MATKLRPIGHQDRLSIVDHLDELRSRLVICAIALAIAFAACFWQNHALLGLLNKPLENSTPTTAKHAGNGRLAQAAAAQSEQRAGIVEQQQAEEQLSRSRTVSAGDRASHALAARGLARQAAALPKTIPKREPITTGVGEPFTTTFSVALYFALLFALPVLLYQFYAFILPAFSPRERRAALPLMAMVPFLFIGGACFAYFLVLPPAIAFLQNFNDQSFDVLIQAKPYYTFEIFTLLALGLMFQLPVGLLAMQRVGIISRRTLTSNWRYAIVLIAVIAAALPGVDPVTTMLEMVPLLLLYGLSIGLMMIAERGGRGAKADEDENEDEEDSSGETDDSEPPTHHRED